MRLLGMLKVAVLLGFVLVVPACGGSSSDTKESAKPRVLIFSHSTGWRHKSIEAGVASLTKLAETAGYRVLATEDPDIFNDEDLAEIDAIVLVNSTSNSNEEGGEWWVGERRAAFQNYVRNGGGVVAIHGASDSHYNWPWYGQLIGGYFERHPQGTPQGTLHVVNASHTSTDGLPAEFSRVDEWYYIKDYNPEVHILLTLDPASIGEKDANPNPISWYHEFDGGRVFYTSMGHTEETYEDLNFLRHVAGGLRYVMGKSDS